MLKTHKLKSFNIMYLAMLNQWKIKSDYNLTLKIFDEKYFLVLIKINLLKYKNTS